MAYHGRPWQPRLQLFVWQGIAQGPSLYVVMSAQGVFFHLQRIGSALLRTVMRWEMAQFEDLALLVGGFKPSEK